MNVRGFFKTAVSVFVCVVGLSVIGLTVFFIIRCHSQSIDTFQAGQAIADSLKRNGNNIEAFHDSAQFYFQRYEKFTYQADSLANADSMDLDQQRAKYSADLREKIRRDFPEIGPR